MSSNIPPSSGLQLLHISLDSEQLEEYKCCYDPLLSLDASSYSLIFSTKAFRSRVDYVGVMRGKGQNFYSPSVIGKTEVLL